jgi:acyl carrier protein
MVMMTKAELAVRTQVASELGLEGAMNVAITATLEELGADSLDRMHLHISLEDMFQIEIPWEAGEQMRTVADIVSYIEEHRRFV